MVELSAKLFDESYYQAHSDNTKPTNTHVRECSIANNSNVIPTPLFALVDRDFNCRQREAAWNPVSHRGFSLLDPCP